MLHYDATRLFAQGTEGTNEYEWNTSYDAHYKSSKKARLHADRDGTAFASVALPSHYSVIYGVLSHVKQRLGPEWTVDRVIDWGSGTGTGLWCVATAVSFHIPRLIRGCSSAGRLRTSSRKATSVPQRVG